MLDSLDSQTLRYRGQETRIAALFAAISPLLLSSQHNVCEVLPHTAKYSMSCATTSHTHAPHTLQRKLLDTIATLCSLHAACVSAAVALEVASDRATLYIAMGGVASSELKRDVEGWIARARDVAEGSGHPTRSANIEEHAETLLMAGVYRACYAKIRARIREDGRLVDTIRRLSETVPDKRPVQDGEQVAVHEDPDTPLGKLCMNLELLMSCTEPEAAGEGDEIRLAAACIAGWSADRALREDWHLCRTVDSIDTGAIQVIQDVCVLSTLVDTLVSIAKCGGVSLALPLLWTVEWVEPRAYRPSSKFSASPDAHVGSGTHPESVLIRDIVDNALSTHPYIATSALPCYPCVMLVRSVNRMQSPGTESGTGRDFMLRGCDACVVHPWLFPWAGSQDDNANAKNVMRELEKGLECDLDKLQARRSDLLVGDMSKCVRELIQQPVKVKVIRTEPSFAWPTGCVGMQRVPTP